MYDVDLKEQFYHKRNEIYKEVNKLLMKRCD
jgi:hypothetical protein